MPMNRQSGLRTLGALLSRRTMIKLSGLSVTALITGQWRSAAAGAAQSDALSPALTCILSPEMTEGPYYIAREKIRGNITEHHPGTPLKLRLNVVDATTC